MARGRHRQHDEKDTLAVCPWYWRDWRASEARAALKPNKLAVWCYRELLDAHWSQEDGQLPDDDMRLAGLADVSLDEWLSVRELVLPWLPLQKSGRRRNSRAHFEWKKAREFRKGARARGKEGAKRRWEKENGGIAEPSPGYSSAIAGPMANGSSPPPPPPPPPPPKQRSSTRKRGGDAAAVEHTTSANGTPPPAADLARAIDYDPGVELQVQLADRCVALASREAALEGREPTGEDVLLVLQSVSHTKNGSEIDRSLRDVSDKWLAATLRECDNFERELEGEEAPENREQP